MGQSSRVVGAGAGAEGAGARAYLAVAGGFEAPLYLGSRSTFILGKFGGQSGRVLRSGDVLHIGKYDPTSKTPELRSSAIPRYGHEWEIGVLYGPHGSPDFFTPADIEMFFATSWKIHYNSDRTGIRLIGPKPRWARKDGGEAGLQGSMTKVFATEAYQKASRWTQEMAGAEGLLQFDEPDAAADGWVEYHARHAPVTTIYGGTSEINRNNIAERHLGLPSSRR